MGATASKPEEAAGSQGGPHAEGFDAGDMLRRLQETEGYEVYDIFERAKGTRVSAPMRIWLEAVEDHTGSATPSPATSTSASASSTSAPPEAASSPEVDEVEIVDLEPWVVLSSAPARKSAPKGRGQPPPKAKGPPGKAPPPAAAKAKAGLVPAAKKASPAPPPPFGKRLHWKLLPPASLGATIFEELRPWGEAPPINTCQLERLFAPPAAPPPRPPASVGGAQGGLGDAAGAAAVRRHTLGGPPSSARGGGGGQVQLFDNKRAQNLAIVLRQVPIPTEELSEALRWMRLSHPVTVDALEHISDNLLPPLLESAELLRYDGPPEALRDVERQLLPLARLPRLKARVQIMLFSKNVPVLHGNLLSRIRALRDACSEVRSSAALRQVFGTVLRVGNYLNHGVDAPDAGGGVEVRGFAVESLLKLRDFRAAQGGEVSALHCVVIHLLPSSPQLLAQLRGELRAVLAPGEGGAAGLIAGGCITDLRDAVAGFRSETDLVQGEIERFADYYRWDGGSTDNPGALGALQRLVDDASEMARGLQEALSEAQLDAQRLLQYFGEQRRGSLAVAAAAAGGASGAWDDEASASVERFFATIREFVVSFEECWREVLEQPRRLRLEAVVPPGHGRGVHLGPGAPGISHPAAPAANPAAAVAATALTSAHSGTESSVARPGSPLAVARRSSANLAAEAAAAVRRRGSRSVRAVIEGGTTGATAARAEVAEVD